jgi:hypothetical protein
MPGLGIGLYESPTGTLLLDLAARGSGHRFSTGRHGFHTYTCTVPRGLIDSFYLYDRPGLPHVAITWQGAIVWEGRVEDVSIVDGGVKLTALGYWRALSDVPYSALWSTTDLAAWRPVTVDDLASRAPEMFSMDNNGRLFIGLEKNAVYPAVGSAKVGEWTYAIPHGSARQIVKFSCDYELLAANTIFRFRISGADEDFGNLTFPSDITSTGVLQTGSLNLTITAADRLLVSLFNVTAGASTYSGETGANYLKLTNIRIKTTSSASVYADEIAEALVAYVNGINSTQLSSSTALIESPAVDLSDEIYEDEDPADIIDRLADLGDNSSPVGLYEAGVWDYRVLAFQRRGSTARTWYVDVTSLEVERTLETLRNSVYAAYQEETGRTLRTSVSADADSVARYGLTRRRAVDVRTTSSTQADKHRDAALQDGKDPAPRAALDFRELYDAAGVRWPLFMARAWDTVVIRNLPPTLSVDIDRIRIFRISKTDYFVEGDVLTVTPEEFLPRLDVLVTRQGSVQRKAPPGERVRA